ncbi:MAG: hypothetical protein WCT32_04300 [Patescibacteria group bacterium]
MPRREYQIKVSGTIDPKVLFGLGATHLADTFSVDSYLAIDDGNSHRIREEGDRRTYAVKGSDVGVVGRVKDILEEQPITTAQAEQMKRRHGVVAQVRNASQMYRFQGAVISIDCVERLGSFVEVSEVDSEEELFRILALLGFAEEQAIKKSYLDMVLELKIPAWRQSVIRVHGLIGEAMFGVCGGVMTIAGVLIGVASGGTGKEFVIKAMAAAAFADSLADGGSMYFSKIAEGASKRQSVRYALGTFAGKALMAIVMLLPVLFMPLRSAIVVNLFVGFLTIALIQTMLALATWKPWVKEVGQKLTLALVIVILAHFIGSWIDGLPLNHLR